MPIYVQPAHNAVNFDLSAFTPEAHPGADVGLSAYAQPAHNLVDFALVAYTQPSMPSVDFELAGGGPVTPTETINVFDFPMRYYQGTSVEELRSRVSGATVVRIANDFPLVLVKAGKSKVLASRWS